MTSQFDIDCRHYGNRKLNTACLVDINDHQESTERHRQRTVRQTTETPRLKRVIVSWIKLEKHEKERQTSFIIYCRHLSLLSLLCVTMPLHDGQVGSLPPSGRPPTRQVSPAGYMFIIIIIVCRAQPDQSGL